MKKQKNALLIIDPQNDFCHPNGSLFVPGADEDNKRLAQWILDNNEDIDTVVISLDSHQPNDIAHPVWFQDKDGNAPNPFSVITAEDVENGTWSAKFFPSNTLKYLKALESEGEFPHVIWPQHCIVGSWGHNIDERVLKAVESWTTNGKFYRTVAKGTNPLTEHFGIFRANIPLTGQPETQLNFGIIKLLEEHDNVFFAGQAKSHCVANSLKQVIEYTKDKKNKSDLANKFVIMTDCMSDVPGGPNGPGTTPTFGELAQSIYDEAKSMGIRFSDSTTRITNISKTAVTA